jgi:hypothetical protein
MTPLTVRPSIITSILLAATAANPRAVTDHVPLLNRATWTPSASAIASAVVTLICISCSIESRGVSHSQPEHCHRSPC